MRQAVPLLLILCTGVLGACQATGGECPPTDVDDHFKTTGFSTSTLRATYPDSSRTRPELSPLEGDTLTSGQLAIQMKPEKVFYSQVSSQDGSFHLFPTAYACSLEEPRSEDVIEDLRIYGSRSFRGRTPGETLSAFFEVGALNEADYGYRQFELDEFLSMNPRAVDELILLLDATPDTTARIQFTIEYEQKGPGLDEYEYTTDPVVLVAD